MPVRPPTPVQELRAATASSPKPATLLETQDGARNVALRSGAPSELEAQTNGVAQNALENVRATFQEVKSQPKVRSVKAEVQLGSATRPKLNLRCSVAKNRVKAQVTTKNLEYLATQTSCFIEQLYAICDEAKSGKGFFSKSKKLNSEVKESVKNNFNGYVLETLSETEGKRILFALQNLKSLSVKQDKDSFITQIVYNSSEGEKAINLKIKDGFLEFQGKNGVQDFNLHDYLFNVKETINEALDKDPEFAKESGQAFFQAMQDNWGIFPGYARRGQEGPKDHLNQFDPNLQQEMSRRIATNQLRANQTAQPIGM